MVVGCISSTISAMTAEVVCSARAIAGVSHVNNANILRKSASVGIVAARVSCGATNVALRMTLHAGMMAFDVSCITSAMALAVKVSYSVIASTGVSHPDGHPAMVAGKSWSANGLASWVSGSRPTVAVGMSCSGITMPAKGP